MILKTFDQMVTKSGKIAAMNAYFAAYGVLPPESVKGEHYEAVGDPHLDELVEMWIKSNCSR